MEKIVILDFGSQTTQLIARRLRDLNEYCEIIPYNKFPEHMEDIKGVILSGSPHSVYDTSAFTIDLTNIRGKFPILGICYGAQYIAHISGGKVESASTREYGRANLTFVAPNDLLFRGIQQNSQVWMSHGDSITSFPTHFQKVASSNDVSLAAYKVNNEQTWGVQFHPEVYHTTDGTLLLENFLNICGCTRTWSPASFIETTVENLQKQLGNDKVVLGLSGGVDSSVAAMLLHKAIGKNLTCIFVNNGLLRKNEFENVMRDYQHIGIHLIGVNAQEQFYDALKGVSDPEQKRKIIGKLFIEVFDEEAHSNLTATGVTLNWNAPTGTAPSGYEIEYGIAPAYNQSTTINALTKTITGLTQNKTYNWRVRSLLCSDEVASFAQGVAFTTLAAPPACVAPVLGDVDKTANTATLHWTAGAGTGTAYVVHYKSGAENTVPGTAGTPTQLTGLTSNTTYTWWVVKTCSSGGTMTSAIRTFKTDVATTCVDQYDISAGNNNDGTTPTVLVSGREISANPIPPDYDQDDFDEDKYKINTGANNKLTVVFTVPDYYISYFVSVYYQNTTVSYFAFASNVDRGNSDGSWNVFTWTLSIDAISNKDYYIVITGNPPYSNDCYKLKATVSNTQ